MTDVLVPGKVLNADGGAVVIAQQVRRTASQTAAQALDALDTAVASLRAGGSAPADPDALLAALGPLRTHVATLAGLAALATGTVAEASVQVAAGFSDWFDWRGAGDGEHASAADVAVAVQGGTAAVSGLTGGSESIIGLAIPAASVRAAAVVWRSGAAGAELDRLRITAEGKIQVNDRQPARTADERETITQTTVHSVNGNATIAQGVAAKAAFALPSVSAGDIHTDVFSVDLRDVGTGSASIHPASAAVPHGAGFPAARTTLAALPDAGWNAFPDGQADFQFIGTHSRARFQWRFYTSDGTEYDGPNAIPAAAIPAGTQMLAIRIHPDDAGALAVYPYPTVQIIDRRRITNLTHSVSTPASDNWRTFQAAGADYTLPAGQAAQLVLHLFPEAGSAGEHLLLHAMGVASGDEYARLGWIYASHAEQWDETRWLFPSALRPRGAKVDHAIHHQEIQAAATDGFATRWALGYARLARHDESAFHIAISSADGSKWLGYDAQGQLVNQDGEAVQFAPASP